MAKKYSLACLSSMGVRITPDERMSVHNSTGFYMQATSAETNVLSVSAALGRKCLVMTKFVEDSPIAEFIRRQLRMRGISYEGISVPQGGPWGLRHQFNIADSGYGLRAPRVWNDRAGEVGATVSSDEFDLDRIFGSEGVEILHLSGLIAAMSPGTTECCLDIARKAKQYGAKVSFDLNYRASFWQGREEQLRAAFDGIAGLADILIGNEEDYQLCLGIEGPEAGGRELCAKTDSFRAMIERARVRYPKVQLFATTLREVISANRHNWGAMMLAPDGWHIEQLRPIDVLDRIGGGDGFTGGLLYGILSGFSPEDCLKFAWASGALVVSSVNDYAEPLDEKQVWDIYNGNARVQR